MLSMPPPRATHRKVSVVPQQLALCRQAVAPRAPGLLEVRLERRGDAPVDEAPDVGLVNALQGKDVSSKGEGQEY